MAKYRVSDKRYGRWNKVFEGEVDPDIIEGRATLQARPFGLLYHVDGRVLEDGRDRVVPGITCRFEMVEE